MQKREIIVFGAGNIGKEFIYMTRYENSVLRIVDNDRTKWGKKMYVGVK